MYQWWTHATVVSELTNWICHSNVWGERCPMALFFNEITSYCTQDKTIQMHVCGIMIALMQGILRQTFFRFPYFSQNLSLENNETNSQMMEFNFTTLSKIHPVFLCLPSPENTTQRHKAIANGWAHSWGYYSIKTLKLKWNSLSLMKIGTKMIMSFERLKSKPKEVLVSDC